MLPHLTYVQSDHWCKRVGYKAIVVHGTAHRPDQSFDAEVKYLKHNIRGVSYHLMIDHDGSAVRLVTDDRGANHCGYSTLVLGGVKYNRYKPYTNPNRVTLGVALYNLQNGRDAYTTPALLTMGFIINRWRDAYGALPIFRHADIDPLKRDPVNLSVADIEAWCNRARTHFAA